MDLDKRADSVRDESTARYRMHVNAAQAMHFEAVRLARFEEDHAPRAANAGASGLQERKESGNDNVEQRIEEWYGQGDEGA